MRSAARPGNHHPSIAPYGLFHCRDGSVQIAVGSEGLWQRLCSAFGLDPAAPGVATNAERVAHRDRVIELVEAAFADWPPSRCSPVSPRWACRRARFARSTRCMPGTRPRARVCSSTSTTRPSAASRCPGRPCASSTVTGPRSRAASTLPRPPSTRTARRSAPGRRRVMARRPWTAHELLDLVLDAAPSSRGTSRSTSARQPEAYRAPARGGAARAGTDESVLTGRGLVRGRP